jgi:hypothetical protein
MDYKQAWQEIVHHLFMEIDNYEKKQQLSNDDSVRLIELKSLRQRMRDYEVYLIEK